MDIDDGQHAVSDPAWPFCDAPHVIGSAAWVYLDHLGALSNGHGVMRELAQYAVKRSGQDRHADPCNLLALPNCVADAERRLEHSVGRRVDVAIACMAVYLARLAGQWKRGAVR